MFPISIFLWPEIVLSPLLQHLSQFKHVPFLEIPPFKFWSEIRGFISYEVSSSSTSSIFAQTFWYLAFVVYLNFGSSRVNVSPSNQLFTYLTWASERHVSNCFDMFLSWSTDFCRNISKLLFYFFSNIWRTLYQLLCVTMLCAIICSSFSEFFVKPTNRVPCRQPIKAKEISLQFL